MGENESMPHGSVESPVSYKGPVRVKPPTRGDVESDEDDGECVAVQTTVVGSNDDEFERSLREKVMFDDDDNENEDDDVEKRGVAVGFDDEERSVDESENEEDRMFIDDDELSEEELPFARPLRERIFDDEWDVGILAKRVRLS